MLRSDAVGRGGLTAPIVSGTDVADRMHRLTSNEATCCNFVASAALDSLHAIGEQNRNNDTLRQPAPSMLQRSSLGLDAVRDRIRAIESADRVIHGVLPFGIDAVDRRIPGGGLALGALHEVAGGGNGAIDGAAAALFAAGIMARTAGQILWCVTRRDLFAPAIAQAGLHPDRVIYAEVGDEKSVLACFEEGLRHGGLAGVVGEVAKLNMTSSRRLQLAAEASGTLAIAIRRWRRMTEASDFGQPTASITRWRVSAVPSEALPVPGISRARWLVELIRARAGESADFVLEACDEQGRLALPADMADRPVQTGRSRVRTAA